MLRLLTCNAGHYPSQKDGVFSELATKTLTGFTISCVPRIVGWKITTRLQWLSVKDARGAWTFILLKSNTTN